MVNIGNYLGIYLWDHFSLIIIKAHEKFQNKGKQKIIAIIITFVQINLAAHLIYVSISPSTVMKPIFGELKMKKITIFKCFFNIFSIWCTG